MIRAFVLLSMCLVIALVSATGPRAEADVIEMDTTDDNPVVVTNHVDAIRHYINLLNKRMVSITDLVGLEFAPECASIRPENDTCPCCNALRIECKYAPLTSSDEKDAFFAVMIYDQRIRIGGRTLEHELRAAGLWNKVVVKMERYDL